jgi:hypothetical protein
MFLINGQDISSLGMYFKKGTIFKELLKMPKPKERQLNNWSDENGYDYDNLSPTYFEPLEYNPTVYLVANNLSQLITRRDSLIALLNDPEGFTLTSITLGKDYLLRFVDSGQFNDLTPVWKGRKLFCEIQMKWINNHEQAEEYGVLYDDNDVPILDEEGHYIIVKK